VRTLGRYQILRALGAGAAGGVFLVEDRIRGGAPIALKRLNARADELLRASFEREFAVLAQVALPGVARVLDFGLAEPEGDDLGGPFFTRSYVEGEPLDVAAARLDVNGRIALLVRVAAVVGPLHRRGVVHGDLKPANLIVDADGAPHVIDFGLARATGERASRESTGGGTPEFMAPELLSGEGASVRGDVYALGATLWTVLTGAPPFAALGARALGARLAGKLPEIPGDLSPLAVRALGIALRALAPDPTRRLPAVDELRIALEELLPDAQRVVAALPFVVPRPRGHERALARLDSWVESRPPGGAPVALVSGARGAGRTTLLRELKWRLQVRGVRVLEASGSAGEGLALLAQLVRQAAVLATDDDLARHVGERALEVFARGDAASEGALADALARLVAALVRRGRTALFVDDLDHAETTVGAALRGVVHADGVEGTVIVASASDVGAPAVKTLGAHEPVALGALSAEDVAQLAADGLGPVDASVVAALVVRTSGVAGSVIEALAALATKDAPTAEDVRALPVGAAGASLAQARLAAAPADTVPLLRVLAVAGGAVPERVASALTRVLAGRARLRRGGDVVATAEALGLVVRAGDALSLADDALADAVRAELGEERVFATAVRLLAAPVESGPAVIVLRGRLAIAARDLSAIRTHVPGAARELAAHGAGRVAAALLSSALEYVSGPDALAAHLELSRLRYAAGEYDDATRHAQAVLGDAEATEGERSDAVIAAGRALTAAGRYDDAVTTLAQLPSGAPARARALARRELAKVHLRRGEYDAALAAAEDGLAAAASSPEGVDDPVRVELLTSAGMVASYRGDRATARARYEEALGVARRAAARRDEANVLTYLAIDHQRAGELPQARDLYAQSLEIARELGDVGSMATFALNLGTVSYTLGEPARAAEHYEAAARLARRAGRTPTDLGARVNLANVHVYLGLYERARAEAEQVRREAEAAGLRAIAAQATTVLAERAAREGSIDVALAGYDDGVARYRALGQKREVTETLLDSAEVLLDRDGPVDASAAAARLAEARSLAEEEGTGDFKLRLRVLLARARGATGDADGAAHDLEAVLRDVRAVNDRELEWQVLAAAGRFHALRGADFLSRRHDQMAVEVLEAIAGTLARDHREPFWNDPRRRDVRRRATTGELPSEPGTQPAVHGGGGSRDERATRLLEITKRLATEHDLSRLLERITDAAVDLSGAERGFVLLVDESGALAPRTARDTTQSGDPHVAFSQSIAEAVLIDGEPIVTVDARDDRRLSEYMSVHKLMLRSVACLPIRGSKRTVGVLYLEHRLRRGRFEEADLDLLFAFADQAAIALENARLIEENERRRGELEEANRALAAANAEIERLLVARTAELDDARRDLDRARAELVQSHDRDGIVGRSEPMRRVFAMIDRVRDTSVPVVIHGESGTGKELVARAIHYGGARAKRPFVAINCAAIPEALLESELFGHARGAFTGADRERRGVFAQASGGTLLLDEIGDMPSKMQVDLLRVLQDGRVRPVGSETDELVDVRVIAASNKPLAKLVQKGRFREDLFYRLSVVDVQLPPLRERPEDIPLLIEHFLARFAEQYAQPPKRLSRDAVARLVAHPLPGNVRQLEHVLLHAWVLVEGAVLREADLGLDAPSAASAPGREGASDGSPARAPAPSIVAAAEVPESLDAHKTSEKRRILEALAACGWNRVRAAAKLGIPRRTFYRRLREHGILEA
jgi:transcriptional regulator with GAF, ATPase, and Fis domain/tetratricopeptide (TPR) repeat protein